ncbi:MAG: helix-turn-helix domain-containing protein [Candidatus Marinimicrobia bacterium]|nr:helix-turn-helix domain-containing protein [Candidatus Neomarinimicrobiota bacterium]
MATQSQPQSYCPACGQPLNGQVTVSVASWLSFNSACRYLGIGRTKLRRLISEGRLKYYRLDGQLRFHRRDCDALILFDKPHSNLKRLQKQKINELAS